MIVTAYLLQHKDRKTYLWKNDGNSPTGLLTHKMDRAFYFQTSKQATAMIWHLKLNNKMVITPIKLTMI